MTRVRRVISCFDKQSGRIQKEIALSGLALDELQKMFGEPKHDLMYEMYELTPQKVALLQPYASEPIDLERHDCYLDCHAEP